MHVLPSDLHHRTTSTDSIHRSILQTSFTYDLDLANHIAPITRQYSNEGHEGM